MNIHMNIQFRFNNSKDAKIVYESLEVDNEGFIQSRIKKNVIDYNISSKSLGSLLSTVDDMIASEIVAEKLLNHDNI